MKILKEGREPVNILSLVSAKMRGKNEEQRTDPFPGPQQGITNDVRDDGNTGAERLIQGVVDFFELRGEAI
jgi:hypothetical protein